MCKRFLNGTMHLGGWSTSVTLALGYVNRSCMGMIDEIR